MEDEDTEYTLLNKREADDWKTCIWQGRIRVCGKGKDLLIKLMDPGSEKLFAQCTIPGGEHDKYVERTTDSSRYFVLKITNGARHAFIGMGFEDRNDSFDFNCALSDFKPTWVDREPVPDAAPEQQEPSKDLSLKEGQKIKINLQGMGNKSTPKSGGYQASGGGGASLGSFALAPPPGAGGQSRRTAPLAGPPVAAAPAAAPFSAPAPAAAGKQDDFFADFEDFQSAGPSGGGSTENKANLNGLDAQLGSMNLAGGSPPAAMPAPMTFSAPAPAPVQNAAPTQTAAPASGGFDMFDLGGLSGGPKPQPTGMQTGPAPAKKRDAFDEFDIFK